MTNANTSFDAWLKELDAEAGRQGYQGAETFTADSGHECWRASYDEGMTPAEALAHDESFA